MNYKPGTLLYTFLEAESDPGALLRKSMSAEFQSTSLDPPSSPPLSPLLGARTPSINDAYSIDIQFKIRLWASYLYLFYLLNFYDIKQAQVSNSGTHDSWCH